MKRLLAGACMAAATAVWATASVPVDAGKSKIVATFTQMGVDVDADFLEFSGELRYDPAAPKKGSAKLQIDTASFDIGDPDYNSEVRKAEWLDSKNHPQATFESTAIEPLGSNRFKATGTLSLKGKTQTVTSEIAVKTQGALRHFSGSLPISRKTFAIGDAEWDEVLDDQVTVKFDIVAPAS
ncbi:YceI family protein [Panacagrimonas sp.]|uniref:YceI family protein n=1 Tax=Panacagrimonas sp. TaxID=2480088 RepID=UPI003B52838D